jgi:hypothetical protein
MPRQKKPDPNELVHNHIKLPRWLHDAIRSRAESERRQIQAQFAHDLASIPHYAAAEPTAKKGKRK